MPALQHPTVQLFTNYNNFESRKSDPLWCTKTPLCTKRGNLLLRSGAKGKSVRSPPALFATLTVPSPQPIANAMDPTLYDDLRQRLDALCAGEFDPIALMATVACEVHQALPQADWTGFYRVVAPGLLKIGPYQGGHGCLTIPFDRCAPRRTPVRPSEWTTSTSSRDTSPAPPARNRSSCCRCGIAAAICSGSSISTVISLRPSAKPMSVP